jgi:hypothetical protein
MNLTKLKSAINSGLSSITLRPYRARKFANRPIARLANGNSAAGRQALITSDSCEPAREAEKALRARFENEGWTIREHIGDLNFRVPQLNQRHVAFSSTDDNGELIQHEGRLQHIGSHISALFRLEGTEQVFNANMVGFMALKPEVLV